VQKKSKKESSSSREEESFLPQDWTDLLPGQRVWVRANDGETFAATVETKTHNSHAVWILRDDYVKIRQVFGHSEGVQLLPLEEADHLQPGIKDAREERSARPKVLDHDSNQHGSPGSQNGSSASWLDALHLFTS
jgi:translation initiation factor IF-1